MSVKNRIGKGNNTQMNQRLGIHTKNRSNQQQQQQLAHTGIPTQGGDARFRLIQKKRQKITDARDRLAEIAKGSDARLRLNKLKKFQTQSAKQQASSNGIQKTNGNISKNQMVNKPKTNPSQHVNNRVTNNAAQAGKFKAANRPVNVPAFQKNLGMGNKTQLKGGSLTRTVNRGPQIMKKIPTNVTRKAPNVNAERYHPLPNNPNVVTIRNDNAFSVQSNQRLAHQPQLKGKRFLQTQQSTGAGASSSMRSTFPSSMRSAFPSSMRSAFPPPMPSRNDMQPLMKTFKGNTSYEPFQRVNPFVQDFKPARLKITTANNNYMEYNNRVDEDHYGMQSSSRMPSVKRSSFEDFNDYYSSPPKRQAMPNNVISRLDHQVQSPTGYKVMVSNLHPMVSVDDVEELFRNVGPIRYARLIREGIAEVSFLDEADAYRSVDVYHNRQLDGQPMNVTVLKNNDLSSSLSSTFSSRYSPLRSRYSPPQQPQPQQTNRRSGMSFGSAQSATRQSQMPKSVLRTAGGSLYSGHESVISSLSNKRSQKLDVAPDLNAIHHALFSGRNSSNANNNSNLQVYIKLPKPPLRGNK